MRARFTASLLVVLLAIAGCGGTPPPHHEVPNPASAHCIDEGGTLEIRTDTEGGQTGYCLFGDGSECEEWAYYRGECQPGE